MFMYILGLICLALIISPHFILCFHYIVLPFTLPLKYLICTAFVLFSVCVSRFRQFRGGLYSRLISSCDLIYCFICTISFSF